MHEIGATSDGCRLLEGSRLLDKSPAADERQQMCADVVYQKVLACLTDSKLMEEHEFVIMFWPQPVQFAPQPPPPPPQPQNFNQAMITLRTMQTKVAVLEAQMQAMSEKMEETMAQMQLKMEHQMDAQTMEMDAQARRMNEKIEARDDEVAVLEAEVEVMSEKIMELQLTMEEKGDAQEARDDEQFVKVSVEQPGVQWHNIKSSNESDDDRLPHDMGRLMLDDV